MNWKKKLRQFFKYTNMTSQETFQTVCLATNEGLRCKNYLTSLRASPCQVSILKLHLKTLRASLSQVSSQSGQVQIKHEAN